MQPLYVTNEITINAPIDTVWQVLTSADHTPKYMYGCSITTDYQPGSPVLWQAEFEDKVTVFVKGTLVKMEAPTLFAYTTFDPNSTYEDIPENHTTVTYTLTEQGGETHLRVTQGDYNLVPDGEKRYNEAVSAGGWSSIMEEIKKVAEGR
jgi:uncharacterized protein YndB with AHSA1/START domain